LTLKDFTDWGKARMAEIDAATKALAEEAKRPLIYLPSSSARKETLAMDIASALSRLRIRVEINRKIESTVVRSGVSAKPSNPGHPKFKL